MRAFREYRRIPSIAEQKWAKMVDLATPEERKWIDEWATIRCMGRPEDYKVLHRRPGESFNSLHIRLRIGENGHRLTRTVRRGVMMITLVQIKKYVREERRRKAREDRREAERQVGAYI